MRWNMVLAGYFILAAVQAPFGAVTGARLKK